MKNLLGACALKVEPEPCDFSKNLEQYRNVIFRPGDWIEVKLDDEKLRTL